MKHDHYCQKIQPLILTLFGLLISFGAVAQTVSVTLTKGDQSALLQSQPSASFTNGTASNATITIDESSTRQTIDGLGFALTQGSAQAISEMNASVQNSLLNELFSPNANNFSIIRISIGASDLSNSVYFYNDTPGDVNMNNFSLEGPDTEFLLPIIKKILAINPQIKVLATPWSAPPWMKTNNDSRGGRLQTQYYAAYARYFVRYLEEMDNEGIAIWGITPQNEPENPFNQPSMEMNASEQLDFIDNHLGPAIAASPFSPKIIAFDHNCDNPNYPITVLNGSSFAEGAAFHLYAGDISAMSTVRNQTGKNVYFTEQFTSTEGNFDGDLGWHMENIVIGSLRNWSKTVIEWNLATNANFGPRTDGGCTECLGAVTVNNPSSFNRNVSYYIISQLSKFVTPGAVRLESTGGGILNVALRNPDGEKVLLVYNRNSSDQNVSVNWGDQSFSYNVPGRSAMTFTWDGDTGTPPDPEPTVQAPFGGTSRSLTSQIEAEDYDIGGASVAYSDDTPDNIGGEYRTDAVDIERTGDTGGGFNVGWTSDGEWLEYTVNATAGTYDINLRGASLDGGSVTVKLDGNVLGTATVATTGGWQTYQNLTIDNVAITGGNNRVLRLEFSGAINLNWVTFGEASTPPDPNPDPNPSLAGVYAIQSVLSGKVLDVADVSTSSGGNVQQWTDFSADNQRWEIKKQGNGTYTLTAQHSGLRLAVANNSNADGANVIQASPSNSAYQRWKFEDAGNGNYRIVNSGSNKALDVQDRSLNDGGNIQQWETFGDVNQQWKLLPEANADAQKPKRPKKEKNAKKGIKLRIYPNPVTDYTVVVDVGRDPSTAMELTVTDMSCRTLFTQTLSGRSSTIQLPASLNAGVYLVTVSDNQQRKTKRMVIR